MNITQFDFNKDGTSIPSPDSTPPSTPRSTPHHLNHTFVLRLTHATKSGDKQQINIVNNGNDVCINNNVVNFTSA